MRKFYAEVIGDPIAQSKSPIIHNFWLKHCGIEAEYKRHLVKQGEVEAYLKERAADPHWRGCNVTYPHKLAAMEYVALPENMRKDIGALNTIFRNSAGALEATNTDWLGFLAPLENLPLEIMHIAIIGAGGAARAILYALKARGVTRITLLVRHVQEAQALLAEMDIIGQVLPMCEKMPHADMLINASPVGMVGKEAVAFDLSQLPETAIVYDIVYAPLETELLKQARMRKLLTIDGLEMLIGQADYAFAHFFGGKPPRDKDPELRALLVQ
jgi:shikimate dehydrogenase